jgi:hypothetical protein
MDFHLRELFSDGKVECKLPLWWHLEREAALAGDIHLWSFAVIEAGRSAKDFMDQLNPPRQ